MHDRASPTNSSQKSLETNGNGRLSANTASHYGPPFLEGNHSDFSQLPINQSGPVLTSKLYRKCEKCESQDEDDDKSIIHRKSSKNLIVRLMSNSGHQSLATPQTDSSNTSGLRISSPDEPCEVEADRIAAEVMRIPYSKFSPILNRGSNTFDTEETTYRYSSVNSNVVNLKHKKSAQVTKKSITVNLASQKLTAKDDGQIIFQFDIISGADGHTTPLSTPGHPFKITLKDEHHKSGEFNGAPMENSLFFVESRGIAIHETSYFGIRSFFRSLGMGSIGSHGCVGLRSEDAAALYGWAPMGTTVEVISGEPVDSSEKDSDLAPSVNRFATGAGPPVTAPSIVNEVINQSGQPLPDTTRAFFEARFGNDLSSVRIHNNSMAADSADILQAKAYTVGNSIAFAEGEYAPQSESGMRLLAHELVHVIQQGRGAITPSSKDLLNSSATDVNKASQNVLMRWPWSEEKPKPHRTLIDIAIHSRNPSYVTDLPFAAYSSASLQEKLDLIRILVSRDSNWYVGPINEIAVKELWRSVGGDIFAVEGESAPLWKLSVERGVVLADLPVVQNFISQFRTRASALASLVLEKSRVRILSEQQRYGLTSSTQIDHFDEPSRSTSPISSTPNSLSQNIDLKNLKTSAGDLATRIAKIRSLQTEQKSLVRRRQRSTIEFREEEYITDQPRFDQLGAQIRECARAYDIVRNDAASAYPILAGFAERKDQVGLEQIAKGASGGADTLLAEIADKLANILKVQTALKDDESDLIWKLDNVIELTKVGLGIDKNSLREGFLAARTSAESRDEMLRGIAIGLLALGLGLLTMGTGAVAIAGASASFALSSYIAFESFEDFQLRSAASGSDFDKAHSVSMDEPSLFWLAMDIIAVGLDLSAARNVFRAVRAVSRDVEAMARAARATEGGEQLAQRITEHFPERTRIASAAAEAAKSEASARLLLTPEQFDTELRAISRHKPHLLEAGSYDIEVIGDKHSFRRRRLDGGWCMFSAPNCPPKETLEQFAEFAEISRQHAPLVPPGHSELDIAQTTKQIRLLGGTAKLSPHSRLPVLKQSFRGQQISPFPKQIAEKLANRRFNGFDEFKEEFWRLVEQDPVLRQGWDLEELKAMRERGNAGFFPKDSFLDPARKVSGRSNKVYQIDHIDDLAVFGPDVLYDMDRMQIVTAEINQIFNKPF